MVVSSLVIVTFLAIPRVAWIDSGFYPLLSREIPVYYVMNCPPVTIEMSCMVALRLSPNDGAFTTQTFRFPLSLFTIKFANISLYTS